MLDQIRAEGLPAGGICKVGKGHGVLGGEEDPGGLKEVGQIHHVACRAVEGVALCPGDERHVGHKRAAQGVAGERDAAGYASEVAFAGLQSGVKLLGIEIVHQGKLCVHIPVLAIEHSLRAALRAAVGDDDVLPLAEDHGGIARLALDHVADDPVAHHGVDPDAVHVAALEGRAGHLGLVIAGALGRDLVVGLCRQPLGHGLPLKAFGDAGIGHVGKDQMRDLVVEGHGLGQLGIHVLAQIIVVHVAAVDIAEGIAVLLGIRLGGGARIADDDGFARNA